MIRGNLGKSVCDRGSLAWYDVFNDASNDVSNDIGIDICNLVFNDEFHDVYSDVCNDVCIDILLTKSIRNLNQIKASNKSLIRINIEKRAQIYKVTGRSSAT